MLLKSVILLALFLSFLRLRISLDQGTVSMILLLMEGH